MERKKLQAITEEEFAKFIESNGLEKDFNDGLIVCSRCCKPITSSNVLLIKRVNNRWLFYCNSIDCTLGKED